MGLLSLLSVLPCWLHQHPMAPDPTPTYSNTQTEAGARRLDRRLLVHIVEYILSDCHIMGRNHGALGIFSYDCAAHSRNTWDGSSHTVGDLWGEGTVSAA
jgi:hypothetical protein